VDEGEAAAYAAGVRLAGGRALVVLQNSGLGNAVNPLASLLVPYRLPAVLLVSWRGQPGRQDEEHHLPMGRATLPILEALGIGARALGPEVDVADAFRRAHAQAEESGLPVALVVPRGRLGGCRRTPAEPAPPPGRPTAAVERFGGGAPAQRDPVVRALARLTEGEGEDAPVVVSTTGYASRALGRYDRERFFYMQGSMGCAAAVALGVARRRPGRTVVVLDGDGALMMRMGVLATVGHQSPANLVHLVLDNGGYLSTGGQPSSASTVDFAAAALACGYRRAARCDGADGVEPALRWALRPGEGPALLHLRIGTEEAAAPRPSLSPPQLAARFRRAVAGEAA
jgi:phosphonopyruvate decarboxylase